MRRFRFVGYPDNYSKWLKKPVFNMIFDEKTHAEYCGTGASQGWKVLENLPDWEEVFETKPKRLHKDTDLGYFAGVFAASGCDISDSVNKAKRLIKQLDKEVNT